MTDPIAGLGQIPGGVACATGHRPQHLPPGSTNWIRTAMLRLTRELREHHGVTTARTGMALGADMMWAWAAHITGLTIHADIPFVQQPDVWPRRHDREYWTKTRARASSETIYGDLAGLEGDDRKRLAIRLLHARNDGMLAGSNIVVALWDPDVVTGGTASAVRKARQLGLPIVHVNPAAMTVTLDGV
jgi:hypothetical protein